MNITTTGEGRARQRCLSIDGCSVSWLTVIDFPMRIGSARVRIAGIAGVGTDSNFRMRGYSRRVIEDTLDYMRNEGYDMSALFGIRDYYHRFGYAVCLPSVRFTIHTRNAEAAGEYADQYTIRNFTPKDNAKLIELHNNANNVRTGTLVRTSEYFNGIPKGSTWGLTADTIGVENASGDFVGYAAYDHTDEKVDVVEVEASDPKAYAVLLAEFARLAVERRVEMIQLLMPLDCAFAEYCTRYGCKATVQYPKCSDGMMRIMNQDALFTKISDELGTRLSNSALRSFAGKITLKTDLGSTTLAIEDSQVAVEPGNGSEPDITLPQSKLTQIVIGYRSAIDLMSENDVEIRQESIPILNALFPRDNPYMWVADHF